MYLSKNDKQLLATFIKAQETEANNFVILGNDTVVKCQGYYKQDVDFAINNFNHKKIRIPKESITPCTEFLIEEGLICTMHAEAVLHVTHKGWCNESVLREEIKHNLINNIVCPIVVALITSAITTILTSRILSLL